MTQTSEIGLHLTVQEVENVIVALSKYPYCGVAVLIEKIRAQAIAAKATETQP